MWREAFPDLDVTIRPYAGDHVEVQPDQHLTKSPILPCHVIICLYTLYQISWSYINLPWLQVRHVQHIGQNSASLYELCLLSAHTRRLGGALGQRLVINTDEAELSVLGITWQINNSFYILLRPQSCLHVTLRVTIVNRPGMTICRRSEASAAGTL